MTTIALSTLISSLAQKLGDTYKDKELSKQYAWWTLEGITQQKKATLLLDKTIQLTPEQNEMLHHWIHKQVDEHMPLHYLIGSVSFASCEILIEPPILIPRPETEEWCMNLIAQLKKRRDMPLRILDLCTGSGCIALALAKELPHAKIYATDISEKALALAKKNAKHNSIKTVTFFTSDLLNDIPASLKFDIIVSNPPYIAPEEWKQIDASVKEWEDARALVAPDQGLDIIKKIIHQAPHFFNQRSQIHRLDVPQLIIEIGYQQGEMVKTVFEKEGWHNVSVKKDLRGNDRIVVGYVPNEGSPKHS